MRSLFHAAGSPQPRFGATWQLLALGVLSWGAVGFALFAQYQWDMLPCPWCTLQRLIYLLIGTLAWAAAAWRWAPARRGLMGLALLLSASGIASALWQHFVAAASDSCKLTWADRILSALGLFDLAPEVFAPMASCADAAVNLLGLPFAWWSVALFGVCGALSLSVLKRP
jgi:disulfide bond formation protein DsbB